MTVMKTFLTITALFLPLITSAEEAYRFEYPCAPSKPKCSVEKIYAQLRTEFGCRDLSLMELPVENITVFRSRKCLLIHQDAKKRPCPSGTEAKNFKGLKDAKICIKVDTSPASPRGNPSTK